MIRKVDKYAGQHTINISIDNSSPEIRYKSTIVQLITVTKTPSTHKNNFSCGENRDGINIVSSAQQIKNAGLEKTKERNTKNSNTPGFIKKSLLLKKKKSASR